MPLYQAGISGSSHESVTLSGVRPSTCASRIVEPHGGSGCGKTVVSDRAQAAPGAARSQRFRPITIPPAPSLIAYSSRLGACSFQVVSRVVPRPERSRSS